MPSLTDPLGRVSPTTKRRKGDGDPPARGRDADDVKNEGVNGKDDKIVVKANKDKKTAAVATKKELGGFSYDSLPNRPDWYWKGGRKDGFSEGRMDLVKEGWI